jgi:hypothetical protein
MLNRRKLAMWAAAGLMAAGVAMGALPGLSQVASAATGTPTPEATAKTALERGKTGSDTYLAEALGITTDQLSAAKETARLAAIQQALDKGLITQAQADSLKNNERIGGRGGLSFYVKDSNIDEDALLAKALNITVEQLDQARQKAEDLRLAADVASGRMTQEQADLAKAKSALKTYLAEKNVYANAVAQAVKDGVITQAQADAILAQTHGKDGFGLGNSGGRGGGRGGR